MYHAATVSGTIDTIPETPGLAVWHDGHIGVYIGNGEVVEAMGTRYGVVKTKLEGARWTHWLKIPYISYDWDYFGSVSYTHLARYVICFVLRRFFVASSQ